MQITKNGTNLPTPPAVMHTASTIMGLSVVIPQLLHVVGIALPMPVIGVIGFIGALAKFVSDYVSANPATPVATSSTSPQAPQS